MLDPSRSPTSKGGRIIPGVNSGATGVVPLPRQSRATANGIALSEAEMLCLFVCGDPEALQTAKTEMLCLKKTNALSPRYKCSALSLQFPMPGD